MWTNLGSINIVAETDQSSAKFIGRFQQSFHGEAFGGRRIRQVPENLEVYELEDKAMIH